MTNYISNSMINFFNILINNCTIISGNKQMEKELIKDIVSIQYNDLSKSLIIETKKYNYVLVENNNCLVLSEYKKNLTDEEKGVIIE